VPTFNFFGYGRSHGQQGLGEPESLSRFGISAMILVLSVLSKAINTLLLGTKNGWDSLKGLCY
jgi:hypothetical protein